MQPIFFQSQNDECRHFVRLLHDAGVSHLEVCNDLYVDLATNQIHRRQYLYERVSELVSGRMNQLVIVDY
jgi:signal transduction histidine kinase